MTDGEHYRAIKAAYDALADAIDAAMKDGLSVKCFIATVFDQTTARFDAEGGGYYTVDRMPIRIVRTIA